MLGSLRPARSLTGKANKLIYLQDPDFTLHQGHVMDILPTLAEDSVDCVVTSPPYYGLRDYGVPPQEWDLGPDCEHKWQTEKRRGMTGGSGELSPLQSSRTTVMFDHLEFSHCQQCGGTLVPLGLEPNPEMYTQHLASIFDQITGSLKSTGTVWVNLGDSYQNKQLLGVPWMFAFEMQRRGWYLRRDIIWSKPNPMPESARDRCTTAHEYIFQFSQQPTYFYDADAIREPHTSAPIEGWEPVRGAYGEGVKGTKGPAGWHELGRNKRSVWTIPVQAYEGAHFATYPRELVALCIKAGSKLGDVVLDPFMGSGTTAEVARSLGRGSVGIELSKTYCDLIVQRTQQLSLEAPNGTQTSMVSGETGPDSQGGTEGAAHIPGVLQSDGPVS